MGATLPGDSGIKTTYVIGKNSRLGDRVRINANATIDENVDAGDDSEIHSSVAIRENTIISNRG